MKLVPLHSVILSRPNEKGVKDKEGNVKHERITPAVGKPFDFTDEEVEHLKASGHEFRTPQDRKEGEESEVLDADAADRAALEAAQASSAKGGAGLDALNTFKTGKRGKAKPPTALTGNGDNDAVIEQDAVAEDEEEDAL